MIYDRFSRTQIASFFGKCFLNLLLFCDLFKSSSSRKSIIVQNEQKVIESDEEKLSKLLKELKDRNSLLERAKNGTENEKSVLRGIKSENKKYNIFLNNIQFT